MSPRPDDRLARYDQAERVAGIGSFEYWPLVPKTIWSDNLYRLYGLNPRTDLPFAGQDFAPLVNTTDLAALTDMLTKMSLGRPYGADLRVRRAGGEERWLRFQGEAEVDDGGALTRAYGTVQDVTERRAAEEAVRDSRQRLEEAMRVAGVGSFEGAPDAEVFEWSQELYRLYGLDPAGPKWTRSELLERMRGQYLAADPDPPVGPFSFEHDLTRADGPRRRYEVRGEIVAINGGKWVRGTVRDVTVLRRGEAQQAAVAYLSRRALEGVPFERLLELACERTAEAVGAEAVGAVELLPDGSFALTAAHGVEPATVGGAAPEAAATLAREALETDAPVIVRNWPGDRPGVQPARVRAVQILSSMAVPIRFGDRPFGALAAGTLARDGFGDEHADFLLSVANVLAAAVGRTLHERQIEVLATQRGRLVAQTLDAEENVRRRVAEAIHDGSLQDLLAARQDLVEAGEGADDDAGGLLERGREGIERAVLGLRQAVQDLHPVVLQHAGLEAALKAAADHAAGNGDFTARVKVDPQACGPRDELVLSLIRELLANAAKHAGADEVRVTVAADDLSIHVEVSDDGLGISPGRMEAAPRDGHIGLASATERVEAIGGSFAITSAPGTGTTVRARLPLLPV